MKIVGISDVSIGYGSPQIPGFMMYLNEYYNNDKSIIIEPDQPEKKYNKNLFQNLLIKRIITFEHPHSELGRTEYILKSSKMINEIDPDVLVIFCTYSLPVLFSLKKKPKLVIYYNIESAAAYGDFDYKLNKTIDSKMVDLLIYPEENRLIRDIEIFGYNDIPRIVIYNSFNSKENKFIPIKERNSKIIYQGSIDTEKTFANYYLSEKIRNIPIDIYGQIGGNNAEDLRGKYQNLIGKVRYMGYVDANTLKEERKKYIYGIVMWNPINENFLYAAPNKFFDSISDGVPPIATPHPQCKYIIDKYECGILMEDWSFNSFCTALRRAMKIYETDKYKSMVENCLYAVERELNIESQLSKVERYLRRF